MYFLKLGFCLCYTAFLIATPAWAAVGPNIVLNGKVESVSPKAVVLRLDSGRVSIPRGMLGKNTPRPGAGVEIPMSLQEMSIILQKAK